jgi:hypothetical protein
MNYNVIIKLNYLWTLIKINYKCKLIKFDYKYGLWQLIINVNY